MSVLLETTVGDLVIDLDIDGSPALSCNFLKLVKARYYTGVLIYNVQENRFCQLGGTIRCYFAKSIGCAYLFWFVLSHADKANLQNSIFFSKIQKEMELEGVPFTAWWMPHFKESKMSHTVPNVS